MAIEISEMRPSDCAAAETLIGANAATGTDRASTTTDVREHLLRYPGLNLVARDGDKIVAVVLCDCKGEEGYVQRLAISPDHAGQGIEKGLIDKALLKLFSKKIHKCHINISDDQARDADFWSAARWSDGPDLTPHQAPDPADRAA